MYVEGGCPFCGRDENHERYLKWEAETEKWAKKYRSGQLTEIPEKYNPLNTHHPDPTWGRISDEFHPAVRGFLKFKYEDMSLFEFLNYISP